MKQLVTIGIPPEMSSHLESRGASLRPVHPRDFGPASVTDTVGGIVLAWDGMQGHAGKLLDARRSLKKKDQGTATPVFLIVNHPEVDSRIIDLAKKAGVAGVFRYPSDLFRLDKALHDLYPVSEEPLSADAEPAVSAGEFPFTPSRKYSVNTVMSRCAQKIAETSGPPDAARRVYFFCDNRDLAEQADGMLAKVEGIRAECFSAPHLLIDAVFSAVPAHLLMFSENNPDSLVRVLEKISLSRRLPRFGIQVMFPGEQARALFLRSAQALQFDQVSMSPLSTKTFVEAIQQLDAVALDEKSPRRRISELRSAVQNPQADRDQLAALLAEVRALPGKERLASREEFFIALVRGDLLQAMAALESYTKKFPDDPEMWMALRPLLRVRKLSAAACFDKCLAAVGRKDLLPEFEHRQLLRSLEEEGDIERVKKYLELRSDSRSQPDRALKFAFMVLAGLTGNPQAEMQWIMDLLDDAPADPLLLMRLGKALDRVRDYAAAGKVYALGAKAAPQIRMQFDLLQAESLALEGRKMRAEEKIAALQAEFPGDPRVARTAKKLGLDRPAAKTSA